VVTGSQWARDPINGIAGWTDGCSASYVETRMKHKSVHSALSVQIFRVTL
jgi:hypothetical protein